MKREQFLTQRIPEVDLFPPSAEEIQWKDPYRPDFPIPSQGPGRLLHLERSPLK